MKRIYTRIKKFILLTLFLCIVVGYKFYSADLTLNATYGINNNARSGSLLPLEIDISNREDVDFTGVIVCNVYENNESVYRYNYDFNIPANGNYKKNAYVSIADRANTIVVEVRDKLDVLITSQRINIDLYSLGNKLIIGIISDNPAKLQYFDRLSLNNGNIMTTTVNITNDNFENNRDILELVDLLVISGIDSKNIGDALNSSFNKFLNNGKVILLGTGENAGFNIPTAFLKYQQGPSFELDKKINLNGKFTDFANVYDFLDLKTTAYRFDDNINVFDNDGDILIGNRIVAGGVLSNAVFDFCDISSIMTDNPIFISKLIENIMGPNRLSQAENNQNINQNRYQNIRDLIAVFESENYPDVFNIAIIIGFYVLILTIVLYSVLRLFRKLKYYGICAFLVSLVFVFIIHLESLDSINKDNVLSFQSITEVDNSSSKEQVFMNIMSYDGKDYNIRTSSNNSLYPVLSNNDKSIAIREDDEGDDTNKKYIDLYVDENEYIAQSTNVKPFDTTTFLYENNNDLNSYYPLDISLEFFDGELSGRVTNKTDKKIQDSSIIFLGKTLYIGDIDENSSVILNKIVPFNSPIGNNLMQSELMCYYPKTKLVKYYLDNNVHQLLKQAKFFGFIDGNETINLESDNIKKMEGNTLLIKNVDVVYAKDKQYDICSLDYTVNNIRGKYYDLNNSIDGNQDVINVYHFDSNYNIKKIYFENLSDYDTDRGENEYNIPYYGAVRVKNISTDQYDYVILNNLNDIELRYYIDESNSLTVMFSPSGTDVLNRKMSLPIIRAIGEKN